MWQILESSQCCEACTILREICVVNAPFKLHATKAVTNAKTNVLEDKVVFKQVQLILLLPF